MTPERFAEVFGSAFCIRYVERGSPGQRKFGWIATFSDAYFTSDSDRIVGLDRTSEEREYGWGETIGEALEGLARHMLDKAVFHVRSLADSQQKAERDLADLRAKLTD
jgi:hypothetical protein